jgi:DmsE family decaheme c-type cytochrome
MRIKSIIAASGVLAILAAFLASPALAQPKPAAGGPVAPVCANCHVDQWNAIDLTPHGAKSDANGSMCQACHGDASAHLKDPSVKPDSPFKAGVPAEKQAAVCLTCHSGNRNLAFWTSGKHAINEVACTNCHSIHGKKLTPTINKFVTTFLPNQADLCGTCHQQIRAATFKPSHHPIQEGKVKCTDCHNPHGSVHYKLLNEHTPNLCEDCHDGSRHPGTIYGAGVGFTCPPGSGNDKVNYPACFGKEGQLNTGVSTRLVDRACLNCHNAIHGSNAPANRGQFFIR